MDILFLIALILFGVSALFSLHRQLQMLQQNSYFPSRYYGWIKNSYSVVTALCAILFCGISLLYTNKHYLPFLIISAVILIIRFVIAIKLHKKSIKKLVVTARVKRLFAAAIIPLAALITVSAVFYDTLASQICIMITVMLASITPILTMLSWLITYPCEKAVTRWYINDAKKILRSYRDLTVIGVTGSYGKTTTKFILQRILSEKFNVVATPQSFNTPLGVVRTVRGDLKPQTQVFICEMGAKNVGDIKEICDIANPQYGIITSVGAQHLDTFRSIDNVYNTKFELACAVIKNGGEAFINGSSAEIAKRADKNAKGFRIYGMENSHEFFAENITYSRNGSTFDLVLSGERISVTTRLLGLHSVNDIVAAAALAYKLGVTPSQIRFAVSQLKPTEHRLELKSFRNGSLLIDDAYNSNPEGCLEAVRVLGSFEGMRKVIITPGLIELGEKEYECNYNLGLTAAQYCDDIILVGKNRSKPMREAVETTDFDTNHLYIVSSFAEAMEIYAPTADNNSVVLLENDLPDNYLN